MRIVVFVLALVSQAVTESSSVELLTPPDNVSTPSDHLFVVARTNAPMVEIRMNGKLLDEIVVKGTVFHKLVSFGYGLNEIEITPIYSGREERGEHTVLQILSGPNIARKYRKSFPRYEFHTDKPPEECLTCHAATLTGDPGFDALELDESCFSCHTDSKTTFRSHIKEDKRACIVCHTLTPELVVRQNGTFSDKNPCYKCHKNKIGEFAQEFVHGPVAGGSCIICHNPHGTEFDNNLNAPEAILCTSCHEEIDDQMKSDVLHPPFRDGRCTACHDPHATNNKWVLVQRSEELCLGCHGITKDSMESHRHPYNVQPTRPLMKGLQLTEKGNLECLSCHNPHGNNTPQLLRVDKKNTCLGCHPDR